MSIIYLDNAATTKMDESLIKTYQAFSCNNFYNPSAGYLQAIKNHQYLEEARSVILKKLGARKGNIIFTSGASEASNLAINGFAREGKWEYITSSGEHPSVYNVFKKLEEKGQTVHYIGLQANGQINYEELEKSINEKTRLVSVMFVSNETGAINDLKRIINIIKNKNPRTIIHVDAVQGFCKIPLNISNLDIDAISISAHKFHGPKGVGALYVKNENALKPLIIGGGQERGYRSGTENLAGIMCMAEASKKIDVEANLEKVKILRDEFLKEINIDEIKIIKTESPYIISMSFKNVNGETLMRALENEVIIGTGSACSTKKAGNRILDAMGYDKDYIKSSIRVSFNAGQTIEEVKEAGKIIMKRYYEILEKVK